MIEHTLQNQNLELVLLQPRKSQKCMVQALVVRHNAALVVGLVVGVVVGLVVGLVVGVVLCVTFYPVTMLVVVRGLCVFRT